MLADPDVMSAIEQMTRLLEHAGATCRMMMGLAIRHPDADSTEFAVLADGARQLGESIEVACAPLLRAIGAACESARQAGRAEVLAEQEADQLAMAKTAPILRAV